MRGLRTTDLFKQELSHQSTLYHLTAQERKEIQKLLLETLADIKTICNESKIPYMAGGGSVLGAVRHHGYIPWDDDLDLNVERQYISKLLSEIEKKFPEKYAVLEPLTTKNYWSSFIQIQRKGTIMQEYLWQNEKECGIKIDIFVIENTYDSVVLRKLHRLFTDGGLFFLSCYRTFLWRNEFLHLTRENPEARRVIYKKILLGIPYAIAPAFFYKRLQKRMKRCKNNTSKYVVIPSGRGHFGGEIYERKKFCETEEIPFEDTTISVTKDYDQYMKRLYGRDYMQLPPEEKREEHVLYRFQI